MNHLRSAHLNHGETTPHIGWSGCHQKDKVTDVGEDMGTLAVRGDSVPALGEMAPSFL